MQDKKSSQWKKPLLTLVSTGVQPLSAQWGQFELRGIDRQDNISLSVWTLTFPGFLQATPSLIAQEDPTLLQHSPGSPQVPIVCIIYDLWAFSFQGIGP